MVMNGRGGSVKGIKVIGSPRTSGELESLVFGLIECLQNINYTLILRWVVGDRSGTPVRLSWNPLSSRQMVLGFVFHVHPFFNCSRGIPL